MLLPTGTYRKEVSNESQQSHIPYVTISKNSLVIYQKRYLKSFLNLKFTRSSAIAEGPCNAMSLEILSDAVQLYKNCI